MDFSFTPEQEQIRDAIGKICARFDDDYWLDAATATAAFPTSSTARSPRPAGSASPCREAYGGAGLGITEAAMMMQAIAESGAGFSGASAVHMNIFGLQPGGGVRHRGAEAPLAAAADRAARTRPASPSPSPTPASNTTQLKTRAVRDGDHYVRAAARRSGSRPRRSPTKMLLLARTTPLEEVRKPHRRPDAVLHRPRPPLRRGARDREDGPQGGRLQPAVLRRPAGAARPTASARKGKGFEYILHGMNPERILIAAEAVGLGRAALARAAQLRQRAHRVRPADRPEPGRSSIRSRSAGWSSRRPT